MSEFDPEVLSCPIDGCDDTLANCLRRADEVWPNDPHPDLVELWS